MGTIEIRWVDQPPEVDRRSNGGKYNHALIARTLRRNPGRWAELVGLMFTIAQVIREAQNDRYGPRGTFEAVVRNGVVYARYVGVSSDNQADETGSNEAATW